MTLIGLDTGFFVELLKGNDEAVTIWKNLIEGTEERALVSSVTLFELERLALKGKITKEHHEILSTAIEGICTIGWINARAMLSRGAQLSQSLGIPSLDALILSWFVISDAKVIYTTDQHLEHYRKKGVKVVNLKHTPQE